MLRIREMEQKDVTVVLDYASHFYQSDAVCHPVERQVLERTFQDAIKGDCSLVGLVLEDGTKPVGYAYLSQYYACEVGGTCVMIEEVFFQEDSRGKGYGKSFFAWVKKRYPQAKRLRLEVTKSNEGAIGLYEKLGFSFLDYGQMVLDESMGTD